jgi:hypothetical protein
VFVPLVLARGQGAPRLKASGLYTRVERDAIKVSGVFVLLVFERGQVVPGWMVFGPDLRVYERRAT